MSAIDNLRGLTTERTRCYDIAVIGRLRRDAEQIQKRVIIIFKLTI